MRGGTRRPVRERPRRLLLLSYMRLTRDAGRAGGNCVGKRIGRGLPLAASDLEDLNRLGFAFDDDVAERFERVVARQPAACRLADDNPSAVILVQRLEAGAEVY